MRSIRLYYPTLNASATPHQKVVFSKTIIHRLTRVLRLKTEHPLVLFNGKGLQAEALFNNDKASATLQASPVASKPIELKLHLGLAVSKGERMDWAIQKSVEAGVQFITPLICERTEVKMNTERWAKKKAHWENTIVAAAEQCGQNFLPTLNPVSAFSDFLINATQDALFILTPSPKIAGESEAIDIPTTISSAAILTGPEGGFSEEELLKADASGFQRWQLGGLVFRAETAPVVALSILQWQCGIW